MIICKTVEEFFKQYIEEGISFNKIICDEELYIEIYNHCLKDTNNRINQLVLGTLYYYGKGVDKDENQAFYWYKKSAEAGDTYAMYMLVTCYEEGIGCEKDANQASYWAYKTALNLGYRYEKGIGREKDENKAFYWYKIAVKSGNTVAMIYLGNCYRKGIGCEKDLNEAFYWFRRSARAGDPAAMCILAICYGEGIGCEKDLNQAMYWYKKSAEAGNISAMYNLSFHYEKGIGCEKDLNQAFYWIEKAVEAGDANAMYNLGIYYEKGIGCEKDLNQAFYWIVKAVEAGDAKAMNNLGIYYEKGIGCEKDLNQALYWYTKALENGNEYARENVERVAKIIEEEKNKKSKLVFGTRKDTFISWNHFDKDIKDDICSNLEKRNLLTVWESDGNGVGDINENIKNAILTSRSYIIVLTGNSIRSAWVEKEVRLILSKVDGQIEYENVIRPIIINRITDKVTHEVSEFDVIKAINELDDNSIFKRLLNYCASFEDYETGLNYDKISSFLHEAIGNSLKIEYKTASLKKYERFSSALNTVVSSRNTKNGIIAATLEFESGYLNRDIYDEENNPIKPHQLLSYDTPSLLYGEAGTGKSLYLKNFMRNEFKNDKYIFYLECKNIDDVIIKEDFLTILKQKAFDNHFTNEEANFVSMASFEELFKTNNKIVVLIDALDEISLNKRTELIEKLYIFYQKYKNVKIILTSRNKNDSNIINSKFNIEINTYELKGLETIDIEKLYDNLSSKYQSKETEVKQESEDDVEREEFDPVAYKESFFEKLQNISEDIKKNPLLISNLIFIYFATHKIPDTSFDIINESVLILINDLEEERNSHFEYMDYIANDNINKILGYLALQRSYNNTNPAEVIIKEYLEENYENIDYSKIADEIYKYLRRRAIIVNENISHEIFKNYFTSSYIFLEMYKKKSNIAKKKYFELTEEGREFLESLCSDEFQKDDETWNNIAIDLLYKLDFEIFNLDPKKIMDSNHLSYNAFDTTLIKTLTEKGYNETTISIIKNLLDKISFHYNEFIKQYIK